jgi:hypothetical protein
MADVFMSRQRIRDNAQLAVAAGRLADTCPPEFLPDKDLWLAAYGKALTDAAIKNQRLPARAAMSLAAELQAG